jgi:hypothetical protein
MSSSLLSSQIIEQFKNLFDGVALNYEPVKVEEGIAHVFFLKYENAETIENSWRKVSNFIALKCQSIASDDFGKWNTYLFFLIDGQLSVDLKYKIENDTFSSRKIVVESTANFNEVINKYILNNDLELTIENSKEQIPIEKREFLWALLEGKTLKKQRKTGAAEPAFDELLTILKSLKDEIQKN